MAENEPNDTGKLGKSVNSYAKYSGLAVQMIVIIGGFAYAGYKIDEANRHETKWVAAVLALAGVFISLYIVFRSVKS